MQLAVLCRCGEACIREGMIQLGARKEGRMKECAARAVLQEVFVYQSRKENIEIAMLCRGGEASI